MAALQLEVNNAPFYRDARSRTGDIELQCIFKYLSKVEAEHASPTKTILTVDPPEPDADEAVATDSDRATRALAKQRAGGAKALHAPVGPEAWRTFFDFLSPAGIALCDRGCVAAEQAAYSETAIEDAEICARMTDGRRALYQEGRNETGPYQSPMEDGLLHFHEFLRRELQKQD